MDEAQFVEIDSIRFFTRYEGPRDQPLILLVHALMANHHMWDGLVPQLHAAGFSTLRYDHVGHNQTTFVTAEAAARAYHFDDFTRHIKTIAERVAPGQQAYGLIGCSIGGVLALRFAQMYPGYLTKVMSCDAPPLTSPPSFQEMWGARIARFEAEGVDDMSKETVARWMPDPCSETVRAGVLAMTRSCSLAGYRACARAIMTYDYNPYLADITQEQVMVLVGENDTNVGPREILQRVAETIPGAQYVLMKNVGHLPPFHDPAAFGRIALDFLTKKPSHL
ncbi:hypothetical protein SPI_08073 [Niveomyces insectorum RCEF 264]|uniref:AB hydrolase-1 domain-containing protein n=1 Tax=Niveomyces insectorum RCEF 264 TaxID=1081102 RepID=A0A167NSE6_9HYPO|nr:hypothetical protein SPI_08073 [Niveomyces insectorum RCEF 264]